MNYLRTQEEHSKDIHTKTLFKIQEDVWQCAVATCVTKMLTLNTQYLHMFMLEEDLYPTQNMY